MLVPPPHSDHGSGDFEALYKILDEVCVLLFALQVLKL
jgi:hypothetical protein